MSPARSLPRVAAVWLAGLALLVRLAVPVGYMPAGGQLRICGGQLGAATAEMARAVAALTDALAMPGMDHHGQGHDGDAADGHCAFAALGGLLDIGAPAAAPVPTLFHAPADLGASPSYARPGLGLAAPPPPKTGPPVLA